MVINKNKNYEDSNLVSIINKIYVDKFYFYPKKIQEIVILMRLYLCLKN